MQLTTSRHLMTTQSGHAHPDIQALNDAIDAGQVASKDLSFAKSLLDQFNSKGKLSSGQMHWVKKLGQAPVTRPHPDVDELRKVVDSLDDRDKAFANDLISSWDRYGRMSGKQLIWVKKLAERVVLRFLMLVQSKMDGMQLSRCSTSLRK